VRTTVLTVSYRVYARLWPFKRVSTRPK